ncbi:MAG: iron-sulfur cluster assembly scaffold protein [Candidatus Parcubacteria bacterium]|nr:iron-sulfur cluster assembly scaffold protein [Candidatus Parcubacteria bacterium]
MQYSDILMDHFKNPRNQGEIANADGVGEVGNPVCGDMMKIYIKVGKDAKGEEVLADIKFQTLGCGAAIASSSMLTELAKGQKLEDALKITREQIAEKLGGLPKEKIHCSILAAEGLKKAVANYRGQKFTETHEEEEVEKEEKC